MFDLDGTLVDNFIAIADAYNYSFSKIGLPAQSPDFIKTQVGGSAPITMGKLIGSEKAPLAFPHFTEYFNEHFRDGLTLLDGVKETLESLHACEKYKLAVFTNKIGDKARDICKHLEIAHYFEGIYGTGDTPWKKPDTQFTDFALNQLKGSKENTCLIGDSPYDVDTATLSQLTCYIISSGSHSFEEMNKTKATQCFHSMTEVGREVFKLNSFQN